MLDGSTSHHNFIALLWFCRHPASAMAMVLLLQLMRSCGGLARALLDCDSCYRGIASCMPQNALHPVQAQQEYHPVGLTVLM
jgi:hypothetical protein